MKLPRRATAGGTTRTPVARMSASSRCANLVPTLSKKPRSPARIALVVVQAEAQQHRLLDPLVDRPLADALPLGDAQAPGVEVGDDVLHGLAHLGRRWSGSARRGLPRRGR